MAKPSLNCCKRDLLKVCVCCFILVLNEHLSLISQSLVTLSKLLIQLLRIHGSLSVNGGK